jgi:hypothetical protein
VYRSPLAAVLWSVFFLNLAVVMARRIPVVRARVRIDGPIPDPAAGNGFSFRQRLEGAPADVAAVAAFFRARGFAVHADGDRVRAVRNRHAPAATLLFHLSFFLVAAGALVSAATRFEGNVDLGAGEEFTGALAQYAPAPTLPRFGGAPRIRFLVEGIEQEVEGDVPVAIRVHLRDEHLLRQTIEVNRPYEVGSTSVVFRNLGIAPALVVTDAAGNERFAGFIRLNVLQDRADRFDLLGLRFTARFYPDHVRDAGGDRSRSQDPGNPVLALTAEAPSGKSVSALLAQGERMELGPYTLTFADWRYWTRLYVRSERGLAVVWAGFALGALALVWRLLFFRREYVASVAADGEAWLAGRAEYYRALFADEALALVHALEQDVARPRGDS